MKKIVKLAIAAAILSTALLSDAPRANACFRACNFLCIPQAHCAIVNGCASCVPNNL